MQNEMFVPDARLEELVFAYCRERVREPVPLDFPGKKAELDALLDGMITAGGHDAEKVLRLFSERLARNVISSDSPRFLSFIPAAPTKASLLFDMVVSCSSLQATSWLEASGVISAENQALRVLSDLAGLPESAGGCFVSGGSAGNLSALVVARETVSRRRSSPAGGPSPAGEPLPAGPLRVAISDQAHSSVTKALDVMGMKALLVPTSDYRLTGTGLRQALDADENPQTVVAVVATAGTTNAGIVDDLDGVGEVAAERGLWFHVDAAYGGAALFAASVRDHFRGIERADSLIIDPHKWLFAPFDCAGLIYREPHFAKAVFTQDAEYLDVIHTGHPEEWNPSDYAYHLTRRARGLPFWFSMAVYGTDAYSDAVEASISVARQAADLIGATPRLELVRPPTLSIVLFRRKGWAPADYHRWSEQLLDDQIAFVTPTTWQDETVARLCFLHPGTTVEVVTDILDSTR